jgi:hypothetical protein
MKLFLSLGGAGVSSADAGRGIYGMNFDHMPELHPAHAQLDLATTNGQGMWNKIKGMDLNERKPSTTRVAAPWHHPRQVQVRPVGGGMPCRWTRTRLLILEW